MPQRVLLTRANFADLVAGKVASVRLGRHDRLDIELTSGALDEFIDAWRRRAEQTGEPLDPPEAHEFLPTTKHRSQR
jgi:hypothetical protein